MHTKKGSSCSNNRCLTRITWRQKIDYAARGGKYSYMYSSSKALFYNEIYYEETNHVKDAWLNKSIAWFTMMIGYSVSCDLFHDMLTYKLIQWLCDLSMGN